MTPDHRIGRRTFLGLAGFGAGLMTLSRLRLVTSAMAAEPADAGALHVLSPGDARILGAIADRITFTGDPEMPRFGDTAGVYTIDTALRQLPADTGSQLHWALLLFEYGPPLFSLQFSTFTGLDDDGKDSYLAGWEQSRYQTRRLAFRAFKNLSLLGYYAQDATWKAIHYGGPWAPRPRRQWSVTKGSDE